MDDVARVLGLESMTVLDHPDSRLAGMDPRTLERDVIAHVERVRPDVLVTYAVAGVSGFPDHLVTHAVVKRVFCEIAERCSVRRLALFTVAEGHEKAGRFTLRPSSAAAIDCIVPVDDLAVNLAKRALSAYVTYAATIEEADPLSHFIEGVPFELFGESFDPPLHDLCESLPAAGASLAAAGGSPGR